MLIWEVCWLPDEQAEVMLVSVRRIGKEVGELHIGRKVAEETVRSLANRLAERRFFRLTEQVLCRRTADGALARY